MASNSSHLKVTFSQLILLVLFTTHCQTLVVSLVTGDVDHWCKPPGGFNISTANRTCIAIPMEADGHFSRCRVYGCCKPPAEDCAFVGSKDVNILAPVARSWCNLCFINDREVRTSRPHATRLAMSGTTTFSRPIAVP
ncbi:hypothetical protein MTO96_025392 [Rhipicephalus appendiculatus]